MNQFIINYLLSSKSHWFSLLYTAIQVLLKQVYQAMLLPQWSKLLQLGQLLVRPKGPVGCLWQSFRWYFKAWLPSWDFLRSSFPWLGASQERLQGEPSTQGLSRSFRRPPRRLSSLLRRFPCPQISTLAPEVSCRTPQSVRRSHCAKLCPNWLNLWILPCL